MTLPMHATCNIGLREVYVSKAMTDNPDRHILVVDDDILTSSALKDHLEQLGYHVTVANNSKEAQECLGASQKINLMILDHLMPDGFGTEVLRAMADNSALQKPSVIMSSCVADPTNAAWEAVRQRLPQVSQDLIKAYVNKPYSISMMDAMVNLLLSPLNSPQANPNEVLSGDYLLASPLFPYSKTTRES